MVHVVKRTAKVMLISKKKKKVRFSVCEEETCFARYCTLEAATTKGPVYHPIPTAFHHESPL